ncbi:MAG: hypothetical protein ACI9R3_005325 [Verrucomicrobiales bacterium]|jgi:hypothetical protein
MKTCLTLLTILILADAGLTLHATESIGLMVAVVSWILLYAALGSALPKWRNGLRWSILFAGLAIGYGIDHITDRAFHWMTGVAAVAAAGHYAGWTGALGIVLGDSQRAKQPTLHGRPGCFNTSFAASLLLAYLCQTTASGLDNREGLIAGFAAIILGFITWELGRSVKGRPATVGKTKSGYAGRLMRWLLATAAGLAVFLIFAQVLPIAADQATHVTKMQLTGDSFDLPDMPDLDSASISDGQIQRKLPQPRRHLTGDATAPVDSVEGLSGGFSQDVGGGTPEETTRLQEFDDGDATGNRTSTSPLATDDTPDDLREDPEFPTKNAIAQSGVDVPDTGTAFWSLSPALVWPFLILTALAGIAAAVIMLILRSQNDSDRNAEGTAGPGRPHWDHEFIPAYLREFLSRAAELGMEKERGATLHEFLRRLRRKGISHKELPKLRKYHYQVQFERAQRNDSEERKFRRDAQKWLQK